MAATGEAQLEQGAEGFISDVIYRIGWEKLPIARCALDVGDFEATSADST